MIEETPRQPTAAEISRERVRARRAARRISATSTRSDVLRQVDDDFAALRRLLGDEGLITPDRASLYRRTHGTHETHTGQLAPANVLPADYEPVFLDAVCNAGVDVFGDDTPNPPIGRVTLRGLPFVIGPETPSRDRCLVVPTSSVSVEVGRHAQRVVVAHRLLEPSGPAGHGVGTAVADYAFHLAGGETVTVTIRERFEIQIVPPAWGREPFLAVADSHDGNRERFGGDWNAAGYRLTEHYRGSASAYYLWCWDNPHPDKAIERVEFIPRGPSFAVAGITLGHLDEHPFVRTPARPVRLVRTDTATATGHTDAETTPAGSDAEKPDVLTLEVDRGVATYPQPLPTDDDRPGWGAAEASDAALAYAQIAAVPSATVVVRQGAEELGNVRWGDVERYGQAAGDRVRVELVDPGRNWVHVKVLDDATGHPVPCRVHFRSPEGIPYQPHGHHHHVTQNLNSWHYDVGGDVRLGQQTYAYVDGTCQGWLPRGDVDVEVARGFEYEPLRQTVRINAGQRELTLRIRRMADLASEGWWSGDSHVHFLSTAGAQLEQLGEDLRIVNLLQSQWGALFTNTEDFRRGGDPSRTNAVLGGGGYLTYVGQENRQHALGHLVL